MARSGRPTSRSGSSAGKRTVRRVARKPARKAPVRKRAAATRVNPAVRPGIVDKYRPSLIPKVWRIEALRVDDFLALDFFLHNLKPDPQGGAAIRANPAKPAYLVAQFQGQAFGEQAFDLSGSPATSETPTSPPGTLAKARLAGPSRLAFKMPPLLGALPLSLEAFLEACRTWPMSLDSLAAPIPRGFSDDLPGGGFTAVFNAGALAATTLKTMLETAGFSETRADLFDALQGAKGSRITRAAALAGRAVTNEIIAGLRRGEIDEDHLAKFADRQVSDWATRSRVAARDQKLVRALVDAQVGASLAKIDITALPGLGVGALGKIPGLQLILKPHKPSTKVTAIEAPYRLFQSPIEPSAWTHADGPVPHGSRTELWHTRLAPKTGGVADEETDRKASLRALWSPDYKILSPINPFKTTLTPRNRSDIVRVTAGYDEKTFKPDTEIEEPYIPKPVTSHRTMLTTLGAWLDSEGLWNRVPIDRDSRGEATLLTLEAWRHLAAMGRDYYVRVVERGFLYGFGHRASVITISERRFEDIPDGDGRAAYLRRYEFIVVREPVRTFPGDGQKFDARDFPFRRVEILTKVTPILLPTAFNEPLQKVGSLNESQVFWPMYDPGDGTRQDVKFKIRATDMSGREISFSMPLIFVRADANASATINAINAHYENAPRATVPVDGQLIELATQNIGGDTDGDTIFRVQSIKFGGASPAKSLPPNRPRFFPYADELDIIVPALEKMAKFGKPLKVSYTDIFKNHEFDTDLNKGQVFVKTVGGDTALAFGGSGAASDGVGGMVAPNMDISGLSRGNGPVGGNPDNFAGGDFDPSDFFPSAKLFGTIDLKDIIAPIAVSLIGAATPKMKKVEFPDRVEVSFQFKREDVDSPLPILVTGAGGGTTLDITARAISYLTLDDPTNPIGNFNGGAPDPGLKDPEIVVDASITNFKLNLFGCVIIWFDKFSFRTKAGEKPDVDPDLNEDNAVTFGGPLEFINTLSEIIPSNGFSDPPMLDISQTGLSVGYSLALPTVAVGIFSLQNMAIGAMLRLPFDGDPVSIRFNFSERQKPFLLTVSLFGGGGFFALALDNSGVREVEAAFEFGAMAAIDLGVASGSVYVKAGIYFHWQADTVELEGYFDLGGEMSVIGIISVSLKFHLALGYYKSNGKSEVKGQATLTVEIEILFFSASVSVSCERRLGGSDADPLFVDFYPAQQVWTEYADAFAA